MVKGYPLGVFSRALTVGMLGLFLFSGCNSSSSDVEKLKAEVVTLKQENAQLKEQLAASPNSAKTGASEAGFVEPHYTDIESSPNKGFIHDMGMLGVYDTQADTFKPDATMTRGEFVTWLFKAHNAIMPKDKQVLPSSGHDSKFTDLPATHPAFPYAQGLADAGYSVGYEDGTFKPDKVITREEAIALKVGMDMDRPPTVDKEVLYSDKAKIDKRFLAAVVSDSYFDGPLGTNIDRAFGHVRTLNPKNPLLRNEGAAMLWQFGQYGTYTAYKILQNKAQVIPPAGN